MGGIGRSRIAYMDFFRRNTVTQFETPLQAKVIDNRINLHDFDVINSFIHDRKRYKTRSPSEWGQEHGELGGECLLSLLSTC